MTTFAITDPEHTIAALNYVLSATNGSLNANSVSTTNIQFAAVSNGAAFSSTTPTVITYSPVANTTYATQAQVSLTTTVTNQSVYLSGSSTWLINYDSATTTDYVFTTSIVRYQPSTGEFKVIVQYNTELTGPLGLGVYQSTSENFIGFLDLTPAISTYLYTIDIQYFPVSSGTTENYLQTFNTTLLAQALKR